MSKTLLVVALATGVLHAGVAAATPRIAFPYLPNPNFIDTLAVEALPRDRLYILIDDAIEPETRPEPWESGPPRPRSGPTALWDESLEAIAAESVTARGETVRVGDRWSVIVSGRRFDVRIREFARFVRQDEDGFGYDEVYAIAGMPKALRAVVGPWSEYGVEKGRPWVLLAAPWSESATTSPASGSVPIIDHRAWIRSFGKLMEAEAGQWLRFAEGAEVDRFPVVQAGQRRLVAVLNVKTSDCSDYGCVAFSSLRLVAPDGTVHHDSGLLWGASEVHVGDVDGDGSDEVLRCIDGPSCDVLRVRDGRVVVEHYDVESGC